MRAAAAARRRTVQATDAEPLTGASKHRHAHSWRSTFGLMRDDPRSIGDRIRERRRELDLSQRDLSQPGISYPYISRIESGQRRPSLKALRKLAPRLETTAHWLETGAPDPAAELAALVLEYGRRRLPRRATQLACKVLGGTRASSS
jgi:transcriptional regulator with XRE-family HTH domain